MAANYYSRITISGNHFPDQSLTDRWNVKPE